MYLGGGQPIHIFIFVIEIIGPYGSLHGDLNEFSSDRLFRIVYIET